MCVDSTKFIKGDEEAGKLFCSLSERQNEHEGRSMSEAKKN